MAPPSDRANHSPKIETQDKPSSVHPGHLLHTFQFQSLFQNQSQSFPAPVNDEEEKLLKMQLSMTTDLPIAMQQLQLQEEPQACSDTLRNMYSDSAVIHLKRTARALASLSANNTDFDNYQTSERLPALTSPLMMSAGTSCTNIPAQSPKRALAPAPQTRIMPVSDPHELRTLIESLQSRRRNRTRARARNRL